MIRNGSEQSCAKGDQNLACANLKSCTWSDADNPAPQHSRWFSESEASWQLNVVATIEHGNVCRASVTMMVFQLPGPSFHGYWGATTVRGHGRNNTFRLQVTGWTPSARFPCNVCRHKLHVFHCFQEILHIWKRNLVNSLNHSNCCEKSRCIWFLHIIH